MDYFMNAILKSISMDCESVGVEITPIISILLNNPFPNGCTSKMIEEVCWWFIAKVSCIVVCHYRVMNS